MDKRINTALSDEEKKAKRREYDHKYYLAHKEKVIARAKKWHEENREKIAEKEKERKKKWRENNKERVKTYTREYMREYRMYGPKNAKSKCKDCAYFCEDDGMCTYMKKANPWEDAAIKCEFW